MSQGPFGDVPDVPGYRIVGRIGRGGFAVVYEAEQLSLGRAVALKMLMPELAGDRDLKRFDRERLLLSELSRHRHVVDVIDAGTTGEGQPFIVMRLYRRGSLAQALADRGPMWPGDVVSLAGKLAGALQAAHNLGVVHRDVKPENVLIADDGEPALADFGISVLSGPERTTTGNFFTMGHVAPEVLQRGEYGVASDVYALASTAFMLLTGHSAFARGNQFAQMRAIVEEPVPPIGRGDVPAGLEAVIARGMAKQPQDRYGSVVALAEAMSLAWHTASAAQVWSLPGCPSSPVPTGPARTPVPDDVRSAAPATLYAPVQDVPPSFPEAAPYPASVPAPAPATEQVSGAGQPTPPVPPALPGPEPGPSHDRLAEYPSRARRGESPGSRRARLVAVVAMLSAVPALVGITYLLGVPPGSALRSETVVAEPTVVIASDLSLQEYPDRTNPTNQAISFYLGQLGNRVGPHTVTLREHDIATPRWTRWDDATCKSVAEDHLKSTDEVAVIGPYNSGCAKLMIPILSGGRGGPIAMVSNGATDPGLTKSWGPGEPGKYYPTGMRNFARVVTTDDVQGKAAAIFAAKDLKAKRVFVTHDGMTYGKHVARAFSEAARAQGIAVVEGGQWNRAAADYRALFLKAKAAKVDAVFLGGAVTNGGLKVVRDKAAVLGSNQTVRLLAADGFAGEPKLAALPEAQGMYVTFPGLSPESIRRRGGAGSEFLNAYQREYGHDPADPYAIYGVAAAQVLVAAIEQSDGTRKEVLRTLFSEPGVTVPREKSVLGADTRIDPATGDVSIKDVTVETIKRNAETFETVVVVP